jgi:hypothetical protein
MTRLVAVVLVVSCWPASQADIGQNVPALTELQRAEAQWQARKPNAYEFAIDARCLVCSARTPPRFRVVKGETTLLDEVPSFALDAYRSFGTTEMLFAAIRGTLLRGQYKAVVKYNLEYGYPEFADLDPMRDVFDEELYFRVINFRVLE